MTQFLMKINRVRERGEADYLPEADGPLSCCDEFLTPLHHTSHSTHHKNI